MVSPLCGIADAAQRGRALLGAGRRERIDQVSGARPGSAHDRDAGAAGRGRKRKDCSEVFHASRLAVSALRSHVSGKPLDKAGKKPRHPDEREPSRPGDQSLSPAAQGQPRPLVGVGTGGPRRGQADRQADPAVRRLCRLPLVPRHGARELRGRRDGGGHERAVRQHQGRPRGAPRHRRHLHGRAACARRAGRLAADHVPRRRGAAGVGRHVLPAGASLRPPGLRRRAEAHLGGVPRGAREGRRERQGADRRVEASAPGLGGGRRSTIAC